MTLQAVDPLVGVRVQRGDARGHSRYRCPHRLLVFMHDVQLAGEAADGPSCGSRGGRLPRDLPPPQRLHRSREGAVVLERLLGDGAGAAVQRPLHLHQLQQEAQIRVAAEVGRRGREEWLVVEVTGTAVVNKDRVSR